MRGTDAREKKNKKKEKLEEDHLHQLKSSITVVKAHVKRKKKEIKRQLEQGRIENIIYAIWDIILEGGSKITNGLCSVTTMISMDVPYCSTDQTDYNFQTVSFLIGCNVSRRSPPLEMNNESRQK
ncbi:hypothetical protein Y032_0002g600 [Ancylostoma ceylanicum]|nr:hypothetical protein Y032_0002g600 [Ancylostoma ceylanicum]